MLVWLVLIALVAAAVYGVWRLYLRTRPATKALRWARAGRTAEAIAMLQSLGPRRRDSSAVHGALGRIHLMGGRLAEAEAELRRAVELDDRDPSHRCELGWTLVALGRLDEALSIAQQAYDLAGEDLEVYCLYCGLMARHGRGGEVVDLADFLKRARGWIRPRDLGTGRGSLAAKLEFARPDLIDSWHPPEREPEGLAKCPCDRSSSPDPSSPGLAAMSARSKLIAAYLEGPALLRRAVADMTPEQLRARPVPGKWSTLEVVCHLVDSEQAYCHRMKRVIAEQRPLLIGYDETRFAATLGYHDRDLEQELALMDQMRRQMARVLRSVPESTWSATGVHSEQGLMTLEDLVRTEAEHIPHHLVHVAEKRKALGLPVDH